jgi:uncharacterized membrane protein
MDQEERSSDRNVSRRTLIRKSAAVGVAAWTAPIIVDSLASPAAAATCATGTFYVAYQSTLVELFPNVTADSCSAPTGTNVQPAAIGLTATFTGTCTGTLGTIAHVASNDGSCQPVTLTLGATCANCAITGVQAHVHNRGAGTCPAVYCQSPSTATHAPLQITAGALGTTSVTVAPNYSDTEICSGVAGIHWGSPDAANGYLLVQITCT